MILTTANQNDAELVDYLTKKCSILNTVQVLNWNHVWEGKIIQQFKLYSDHQHYSGHISCESNSRLLRSCYVENAALAWPNNEFLSSIADTMATGRGTCVFKAARHGGFKMSYEGGDLAINGAMFDASILEKWTEVCSFFSRD